MPFGDRLRETRKLRQLSQDELGDRVGASGAAVSEWERGISQPELAKLRPICRALAVSADYLIENDGVAPQESESGLIATAIERAIERAVEVKTQNPAPRTSKTKKPLRRAY